MKLERNHIIDIAKGIGIILVVFGHVINSNVDIFGKNVNNMIYIFHMPLFFLISGYLTKYEKNIDSKNYIKKKAKGILLPFFNFSLFWFFYWFIIERRFRNQMAAPTIKIFINIFLGTINEKYLLPNIVLWFLPCLFISEVMYYIIRKINNYYLQNVLVIILFIFGIILCKYNIILPFGLETAFVSIIFLLIGNYFSVNENKIKNRKYLVITLFIIFYTISFMNNGDISMLGHNYGNPVLFLLGAISGSGIVYYLAKLINKNIMLSKLISFYGVNSLTIMLCHDPIKRVIAKILSIILKTSDELIRNNFFGSLLLTICILLIMIPIIIIINNYLPFIIGKIKKQKK